MCSFYLQRAAADNQSNRNWDAVDQFTYENYAHAIDGEGEPRYSGNRVAITPVGISMHGTFTANEMSKIMRLLGIQQYNPNGTIPHGLVNDVEFVRFVIRGKKVIHEINGTTYKAAA